MSRVVVLDADAIVDGVPRSAGERVIVPDAFAGPVRRVVAERVAERNRQAVQATKERIEHSERNRLFNEALKKLQAILQADYPQFWQQLQNRPQVQDAIIAEMREQPSILQKALDDPAWFVAEITKRLGGKAGK